MFEELGVAFTVAVIVASVIALKLTKAWIRRLDRGEPSGRRLAELEERIRELEGAATDYEMRNDERLDEIEARVDFTEKLLREPHPRRELSTGE